MVSLILVLLPLVVFLCIMILASETIRGTRGYEDALQGGKVPHESERKNGTLKAALATAKVGMFAHRKGETEPDLDLAVATDGPGAEYIYYPENINAVLRLDPNWDIDTVLPLLSKVQTFDLGCGAIVPVILEGVAGPIAVAIGERAALGLAAGKVRKWAYTDATAGTDSNAEIVGTFMESDAGHATEDRILLMRLDQ